MELFEGITLPFINEEVCITMHQALFKQVAHCFRARYKGRIIDPANFALLHLEKCVGGKNMIHRLLLRCYLHINLPNEAADIALTSYFLALHKTCRPLDRRAENEYPLTPHYQSVQKNPKQTFCTVLISCIGTIKAPRSLTSGYSFAARGALRNSAVSISTVTRILHSTPLKSTHF